jgi:C1A family cysteine protease
MQAPYDQGELGSCDPNTWVGAAEYNAILDYSDHGTLSRLMTYYLGRVREGTVTEDSGLMGRTGGEVLRKTGACLETLWPYEINLYRQKPPQECYEKVYKIGKYVHPGLGMSEEDRIKAFKRILSNQQTICVGGSVYSSFEGDQAIHEGIVPMPNPRVEKLLGGHEFLIVGYLKEYPEFGLCRNSWGTEVMMGGYFLAPWKYLANEHYMGEWRSIYRPKGK